MRTELSWRGSCLSGWVDWTATQVGRSSARLAGVVWGGGAGGGGVIWAVFCNVYLQTLCVIYVSNWVLLVQENLGVGGCMYGGLSGERKHMKEPSRIHQSLKAEQEQSLLA